MRLPYVRGRKAPVWSQATSFAVVVVAGLALGHGTTQPRMRPQQGTSLTISTTVQRNAGAGRTAASLFQRAPVAVLDAGSLKLAAAGWLGSADVLVVRVSAGAYATCVRPPHGWQLADAQASGPAGWACTEVTVGTRPAVAELTFAAAARKSRGGR